MSQKPLAHRPSTGTLPPIAASGSPTMISLQRARSIDKKVQHIGQEQSYSRRLLDNEKQQIKARYERLKKKVSQIRSNLTPEQIAEIQKGSQQHEGGGGLAADGGKVLTSPRGRRTSLEASTAAFTGTPTPPVSPPPPQIHRTRSAHQIVVPTVMAMGHKRVRRLAASGKTDQSDGSSPRPIPLLNARASHVGKSAAAGKHDLPGTHIPHLIPRPNSPQLPDGLFVEKKTRAATVTSVSSARELTIAPDLLKRPRASTASGRLQFTHCTSPKLPTDDDNFRKGFTPGLTPSSPPFCPERRFSSSLPNYRLSLRKVSLVGSPVQRMRPTRRISVNAMNNVSSATLEKFNQWPVAAVAAAAEPPAAFSCHEPKLEDALSRSPPTKNPSRRLSAVAQVSPFQETRARKREELREARIDDNDHLSMELEQRKEKLLRGIESIVGRPHENDNDQLVTKCDSPNPSHDGVLQNPITENFEKRAVKSKGPGFNWRAEMMKIRYLRLPPECNEEVGVDVPPRGTPQLKATTKWRKFVRK